MSRASIILILILAVIVGGVFFLSTRNSEVPLTHVEKEMLNDAAQK